MARSLVRYMAAFFLMMAIAPAGAEHIMGGNIDFRYMSGNEYRLGLRIIIDCENSNKAAWYEDDGINIGMYSRSTNELVTHFLVPLVEGRDEEVTLSKEDCQEDIAFCMMVLSYYDVFEFDRTEYNDPEGYYFSWERCCRNSNVDNIANIDETGMAFYAEVPSFSFINSLPRIKKAPITLLCRGNLFSYDFQIRDPDGDELKITLTEPLKGGTNKSNPNDWNDGETPRLKPGPYEKVKWADSYGLDNIMNGQPDIEIDENTGRLTVRPTKDGFFGFALKIEEYRNGKKLGESNIELQYIVNKCPVNAPPVASQEWNDSTFEIYPGQKLMLSTSIKDPDDSIFITSTSELFDESQVGVPTASLAAVSGEKSAKFTFSWRPSCDQVREEPYEVVINAADNGCPLPSYLQITIFIKVLEPRILDPPEFFCISRLSNDTLLFEWDHNYSFSYGGVIIEENKGSEWQVLDTISHKSRRTFKHHAPGNSQSNYCYRIRTINQCGEVGNNFTQYCSLEDIGVAPKRINLSNISVNDEELIELSWDAATESDFDRYQIFRSREEIGFQLFTEIFNPNENFLLDSLANTDSSFFKYYIISVDDCGLESEQSAIASSILLRFETSLYRDSLYWTTLTPWQTNGCQVAGISTPSRQLIQQDLPVTQQDYVNVLNERDDGVWIYKVGARHSDSMISYSNSVEIRQLPALWIPNSFSPNGDRLNDEWALGIDFVTSFDLKVYNRFGQIVFETNDPTEYWDGENATESNYLFVINCRSLSGKIIHRTGSVVLLR